MTDAPVGPRPAVFLDRDGTILVEVDFLTDPDELELLPGAADAIASLNRRGLPVVVVTNQSGIARGLLDERILDRIHALMAVELARHGAHVDAVLFCPHHPEAGEPPLRRACDCRKPAPGMLLEGARAVGAELSRSWMVGDSMRDVEAGRRAGARAILVGTGKGPEQRELLARAGLEGVACVDDLPAAARHILGALDAAGEAQGR